VIKLLASGVCNFFSASAEGWYAASSNRFAICGCEAAMPNCVRLRSRLPLKIAEKFIFFIAFYKSL
jgi:hypothetical protein